MLVQVNLTESKGTQVNQSEANNGPNRPQPNQHSLMILVEQRTTKFMKPT